MSLSKEILHSKEISTFLNSLKEQIANESGLDPSLFQEGDVTFLYELGYELYAMGDYTKARSVFQRLILARPFEIKFWKGLASSLQMEKAYSQALVPWGMCALLDPNDPLFHYHAALCLFSLGDVEEGKKALECALNLKPDPECQRNLEALKEAWIP